MEIGASFLPSLARMNSSQLAQLYHAMFMVEVSEDIVNASLEQVCGKKGARIATQTQILAILQEIHDRRVLEENAYWDFRALVVNGTQTLSPKDALLFLRVLHGDNFSTTHWDSFMKQRRDAGADVSWSEIKPWVCAVPMQGDIDQHQYKSVEAAIELSGSTRDEESLRQYVGRNQTRHAKEMYQYTQGVRKKAQNNVKLWEQEGLTLFLTDEPEGGRDMNCSKWMKRDRVVVTDVLDILDDKYNRLRHKLLTLLIRSFSGETTWQILSETECYELIDELVTEERRLRADGLLSTRCGELPGATLPGDCDFPSLTALMGELLEQKKEQETCHHQVNQYWTRLSADIHTYSQHLIDLHSRYECEVAQYKTSVRANKENKAGNELYYCQLQRQLLLINSNQQFNLAALAVGLAERSSIESYREVDRKRQEYICAAQLSSQAAHRAAKPTIASNSMTTSEVNSLGDRDLYLLILKQILAKHNLEMRVMGSLLHHRSTRSHKSAQLILSKEDVIRQLTVLGNQRATWREASGEYKALQKDEHKKILQKALAIYYEAEAKLMFPEYTTDGLMDPAILSLLCTKQGRQFDVLIGEICHKKKTALIDMLKREEEATMFEHCDNIAAMLFGSVESGDVDKLYVEQLGKKYLAYRHQIIQYSLSKKFGDSWYSRSAEDQQRHIAKLAISLKELLDQGKLEEMDASVADTTQHISMYQCLGENRLQFERRILSGQPHSSETMPAEPGVFGSLHSRYFSEYAAVLEAAHKVADAEPKLLLALLKAETFIAEQSDDLCTALFLTGLIERVGGVLGNRHSEDLIRVENLAKCLVSNHRLLWRIQGKQAKPKSDVYCDNSSTHTRWVECLLKEVLCKHIDERYALLNIVLDESLRELREVADLQSKEDQHRRLVALQNTQRWLAFDTPDARDENIAILEEAAAIQMCMMYDALIENNQAADVDSIATFLTGKLLSVQERELAYVVRDVERMPVDEVMRLYSDEVEVRQSEYYKNVAKVLTAYTGIWSDDVIMLEIDAKYSLLEKLMLETTLRSSHPQWEALDASHQCQLCTDLKAKTEHYHLSGNVQALTDLYSSLLADGKVFCNLFGDNSFEFAHKIVNFQNVDNLPTEIYSVAEDELSVTDPIAALTSRKDEEKQAYQNLLRGMYEVFLGEQGRAAEVIKLRHHQSMIKSSRDFANLAMQLGLKERTQLVTHISKGTGDHRMMSAGDWHRIVAVSTKAAVEDGHVSMEDISAITGKSSTSSKLFVDMLHTYIMRQKRERQELSKLVANLPQTYKDSALLLPYDEKLLQLSRLQQRNDMWSDDDLSLACAIKMQLWKDIGNETTPTNSMLAELEGKQLFETSNLVHIIADKTVKDLEELRDSLRSDTCQCVYLALTDTTHFMVKSPEQIHKAIENKYETLRDQLLLDSLRLQMGEQDWLQAAEADRQKGLMELKLKGRLLKQQGQVDDTANFFRQHLRDSDAYKRLLSNSILQEVSEEAANEEDMDADKQDALHLLHIKSVQELEQVMADMSSYKDDETRQCRGQEELTRIRRDQRRLKRESQFGAAAVLLKTMTKKELGDVEARHVQHWLATERISARRNAAKKRRAVDELSLPDTEDTILLRDVVLNEMDLKHTEEREVLVELMLAAPHSQHHQQSLDREVSSQRMRLTDLCELRRQLRDSPLFDCKEQEAILQEGICHKLHLREMSLREEYMPCSRDDAVISLLADLQQLQEQEMNRLYSSMQHKTTTSLKELKGAQVKARARQWYDHVAAAVLTSATISEALNPEQEVLTALDQKYDTLKDMLILEGLMNEMGEAEWQALDQKQQQQKLIELKMQEKRLREEGKVDEAKELLKGLIDAEQALRLGGRSNGIDCMKADQARLLQERADALRRKLQSNPASKDDIQQQLSEVEGKLARKSVLDNLAYEYEDEKERLLNLLHSETDESLAERRKQLEMAKLRREKRILKREGELDEASALMHLARKNEKNRLAGISTDKEMQMELARRRLAARRVKEGNVTETEKPSTPTVLATVQERVLEAVGLKHSLEMSILMKFFSQVEEEDYLEQVLHISNVKLRKALEDLENQCNGQLTVCKTQAGDGTKEKLDLVKLLSKAFLYHLIVYLRAAHGDEASEHTMERVREACTHLLASLQESQDSEIASTTELMLSQEDSALEKLADAYNTSTAKGQYDNLVSLLFAVLDDEKKWTVSQQNLNERFEMEKREILDALSRGEDVIIKDGQEVDAQQLLKQLEAEHSAQKNAIAKQMEKQTEMMMARRRSKKQARFEDSCSVAKKLLQEAAANDTSHKTAQELEKSKQGDLMSEKLAKRKASRTRREEMERQEELERHVRPKSVKDAFGNVMQYVPPIMGLKRERTVVNVSDEQKSQEWQKLVKEKDRAELTQSQEQRKQEDMMRARREQRKLRRHSEVEAIFSMGEKQKTMFERSSSENREKQLSSMKERIARIQNEKTMTGKSSRKAASKSFEHLVDTSQPASKDEQMKALAANLQKRFADESQGVREGKAALKIGREDTLEDQQPTKILSQEEKQRILKERRMAKRKTREAASSSTE